VGFDNYLSEGLYRGNLLTHRVLYNHHQHMAKNFLALLHALEADVGDVPLLKRNLSDSLIPLPRHKCSEEDRRQTMDLIKSLNHQLPKNLKLVLINPDPGLLPLRGWPRQRFAALAKEICTRDSDVAIGVIGLERSHDYAREIAAVVPPAQFIDLTGKTKTLADLMVFFHLARVLVTNDSGPAHMAALTGVRTIVLFGPETPALYGPVGDNVRSLFAGLSCSPCYAASNHRQSPCRNNVCLQAISVEQVRQEVLAAL